MKLIIVFTYFLGKSTMEIFLCTLGRGLRTTLFVISKILLGFYNLRIMLAHTRKVSYLGFTLLLSRIALELWGNLSISISFWIYVSVFLLVLMLNFEMRVALKHSGRVGVLWWYRKNCGTSKNRNESLKTLELMFDVLFRVELGISLCPGLFLIPQITWSLK